MNNKYNQHTHSHNGDCDNSQTHVVAVCEHTWKLCREAPCCRLESFSPVLWVGRTQSDTLNILLLVRHAKNRPSNVYALVKTWRVHAHDCLYVLSGRAIGYISIKGSSVIEARLALDIARLTFLTHVFNSTWAQYSQTKRETRYCLFIVCNVDCKLAVLWFAATCNTKTYEKHTNVHILWEYRATRKANSFFVQQ